MNSTTTTDARAGVAPPPRKQLFLHVGCSKSGSSSLQVALRGSTDELSRQGVRFWLVHRKSHARMLLRPLNRFLDGGDRATALAQLRGLAEAMLADPHPRHLLTLEDLAAYPREAVDLVHEAFASLDLTIVITARHWGRTLGSEWQQCLKERMTTPFPDFVEEVRSGGGEAQRIFVARQDVPSIAQRWQGPLPAERVVVIPVADTPSTSTLLADFSGLIGIDETTLQPPTRHMNPSMGAAQAEVLRQLNLALGERLPDYRKGGYWQVVRKGVVQRSLRWQQASGRITLPAEYAPWSHEVTTQRLKVLLENDFTVLGHPDDLVAPATVAEDYEPPAPEVVAAVAARTLADLCVVSWEERAASRRRRRTPVAAAPTVLERARSWAVSARRRLGPRTPR